MKPLFSHVDESRGRVRADAVGPELPYLVTLRRHHKGSSVRRVCFGEDGVLFSAAKTLKLYDLDAGKTVRKISLDASSEARVYSMCVVDRYLVALGDDEGTFWLCDYRCSRAPTAKLKEFDDYISDLDVQSDKRLVLASSGEGTIAAFNVRAKRLEPPQSEVFEAGFNCIRCLESRSKVLAAGDDGVVSIFNQGSLGNISDRFPVHRSLSIERMQLLGDSRVALGCNDGTTRVMRVLPNKIEETVFTHETPIESVSVQCCTKTLASLDSSVLKVAHFEEREQQDDCHSSEDSDEEKEKEKPEKAKDSFFGDL